MDKDHSWTRSDRQKVTGGERSLAAEAYAIVRERVLRGELTIGQTISRRKIARELQMSFLPVSEALIRLEHEGLLESRPRAGTRVRIPTREDVEGHYLVREALEVQAARLFATLATPGERSRLLKLAARVDKLWKSQDSEKSQYLTLHEELHRRIAEGSRCPALSAAIENTHSLASTWLCVKNPPALETLVNPHQDLAKVLCSGTVAEATEAMRHHIQLSLKRAMVRLAPYFRVKGESIRTYVRAPERSRKKSLRQSQTD